MDIIKIIILQLKKVRREYFILFLNFRINFINILFFSFANGLSEFLVPLIKRTYFC